MHRYFIEVSYKGTRYRGFQVQQNANTIQAEMEKAAAVLLGKAVEMTGSSRTDAGVHAVQNYFHFDLPEQIGDIRGMKSAEQFVYKMNAVLPGDISVRRLIGVGAEAHCRFDAVQREYKYYIYARKDPFRDDRAYYFPYRINRDAMEIAAAALLEYQDFTSFSKRNTQVKTFLCKLEISRWEVEKDLLVYHVAGNRFLRGMVRALTATMLRVGRGLETIDGFRKIIEARDCTKASFSVPAQGLFLESVKYPESYFTGAGK